MRELLFNVSQEPDGGYVAVAVGENIATEGDTCDELCHMVLDAVKGHFYDPSRLAASAFSCTLSRCWR